MNYIDQQLLLAALYEDAYKVLPNKILLSSGEYSNEYIDCRKALSNPETLKNAAIGITRSLHKDVKAIGGLTFGADPLSIATSLQANINWFSIRKQAKTHGTQNLIEGDVRPGDKVAIVDDVLTTGGSLEQAIEAAIAHQLIPVQVIVLVNRSKRLDTYWIETEAMFALENKYPNIDFLHMYNIYQFRALANGAIIE